MDVPDVGTTPHWDMALKDGPDKDIHLAAPNGCRERSTQDILKGSGRVGRLSFAPS
jgi:hypothetical protein